MAKIKEDQVFDQFSDWEGWTCNQCGETLPNDLRDMIEHLEIEHDMEVERKFA